jgi:hypothetical protein
MKYTKQDVEIVIEYNKTANIFRITETKRVQWDLRNMHRVFLDQKLSKGLKSADDFAELKKLVRKELIV